MSPYVQPPKPYPQKALTQHQKIVAAMCKHDLKKWWLPKDFMVTGEFFVGYEASARFSELQKEQPYMFETRANGRFLERRIRFETGREWFPKIPKELQSMVRKYYKGGQHAQ